MFKIGELLAEFQKNSSKFKVKHRKYWTTDGLVGENSKFGSIDNLEFLPKKEQRNITRVRKKVLSRLKKYEKLFPEKMGMIHADLHFGNLLKTKSKTIAAIDFDDCGYGFYIYDLSIPLMGLEYILKLNKQFRHYKRLSRALFEGYKSKMELTNQDIRMIPFFILARKFLMIAWLNEKSENVEFKKRLIKNVRETQKYIVKLKL